ncbi:MAG TPA: cadherin domain-containing protein, partial [Thermoanaerobaculia bacterium]|nr:cadherin domain-containing protein [Thermoanaerobaculia bacterium]
ATGTLVGITASASDADATTNTVTYSLTNNAGGRFQIDSATGVVTVLNGALIDYESASSHNITVRADSADGSFSTQIYTVNVNNVNDAPANVVPGPQTVAEDTALAIAGVSVTDVDGNLSTTQLTVGNGTVTVSLAGGATISAGANGTGTLTLAGTQAQINAALATISYQGNLNFTGADTLTVTSTDSNAVVDTDTVALTVTSVNDAPANVVPGPQTVAEDTALSIAGVSVTDVDGNLATTQLTVGNGTVTVSLAGGATISAGANGTGTLTLAGTQAQINAALATISYQGNLNFTGADTLTVTSTDSNAVADTDTVAITVTSVNDAPANVVPGPQTVAEDTALAIAGVSVTDVDGNLATTQLTVGNGTVTVSLAGGATISAGRTGRGR